MAVAGTATHCPYCALQCGMTLVPGTRRGTLAVEARKASADRPAACAAKAGRVRPCSPPRAAHAPAEARPQERSVGAGQLGRSSG